MTRRDMWGHELECSQSEATLLEDELEAHLVLFYSDTLVEHHGTQGKYNTLALLHVRAFDMLLFHYNLFVSHNVTVLHNRHIKNEKKGYRNGGWKENEEATKRMKNDI